MPMLKVYAMTAIEQMEIRVRRDGVSQGNNFDVQCKFPGHAFLAGGAWASSEAATLTVPAKKGESESRRSF